MNFRKLLTITSVCIGLILTADCKDDSSILDQPGLIITALSYTSQASTCAGGLPQVSVVNSTTRANNQYKIYSDNACATQVVAFTTAISQNGVTEAQCVNGTSVYIKDTTGNCVSITLFSGKKQVVTHTLDGATDKYNVNTTGLGL